ncbi:Uncharacterised protein [Bordetella pertussis]|nr:Uncharacterised protein [Bordetella pertussis]CFU07592.1 Uncharacterised protein [Bordetella pertussis]CFW11721.1 Uncharacterised protein [Bordetella pertussis]CPJ33332.1 Uncharacterised protein [Bordetella pertussis]CPP32605.1 Uncharacterised protein [Bordetella pertussis]
MLSAAVSVVASCVASPAICRAIWPACTWLFSCRASASVSPRRVAAVATLEVSAPSMLARR